MDADWDAVIVGRSFAGLSAALTLGRMRRTVLVIGDGEPRNGSVLHAHGLLTRDGANPNDLIALAETELATYPSIQLVDAHVTSIQPAGAMFRIYFDRGTSTASKVILAIGVNDDPPAIAGLADHWGRGVYTCLFCDGYEHRDRHLAVIGEPAIAAHLAVMLTAVTDQVTVYATLEPEADAQLDNAGINIDHRGVTRVIGDGTSVTSIELADGTTGDVGAVFVAGAPRPTTTLAFDLGCDLNPAGLIDVGPTQLTSVAGVWAAGDVTTMQHQMSTAIAQGATAGAHCAAELVFQQRSID